MLRGRSFCCRGRSGILPLSQPTRMIASRAILTSAPRKTGVNDLAFARRALHASSLRSAVHARQEDCHVTHDGQTLTLNVTHPSSASDEFTFHAQWLYDARCDTGPTRTAATAVCQLDPGAAIEAAALEGTEATAAVHISWASGERSRVPLPWLRAMSGVVAQCTSPAASPAPVTTPAPAPDGKPKRCGWRAGELDIPAVPFEVLEAEGPPAQTLRVLDLLLSPAGPGIVRVTGLPAPDVAAERAKERTLVTTVLKRLFGAVFAHPRRAADATFNVASHETADAARGRVLPNYDTNQVLLPHTDHAHYHHPIRVQGWYGLEGTSTNTFVDTRAVRAALEAEHADLAPALAAHPLVVGRVAPYYHPPMYQASADAPLQRSPLGDADPAGDRVRWHPHLTGALLAPFAAFERARAALRAFQVILRRPEYQHAVTLRPGDMYVWDNFRILHGRERVLETPRTGVGQTVPEQLVNDRYRSLLVQLLAPHVEDAWLVQTPTPLLRTMLDHVPALA